MADNYELARNHARAYFLQQDRSRLCIKPGVTQREGGLYLTFLSREYRVDLKTGVVFGEKEADFAQSLSIYDWLCGPGAKAAGEYAPIHALPGVYVRGSGLTMGGGSLPACIAEDEEGFHQACRAMGGVLLPLGDAAYRLPVFPGMDMVLKYYRADEDFPPQLTFLWDKNILQSIRYETVYYVARCLSRQLLDTLAEKRGASTAVV